MKQQRSVKPKRIFPGVLLIGLGLYFLVNQYQFPYKEQLASWPSILVIIGVAFLLQATLGKETHSLFPGLLLTGLGVHFHGLALLPSWPDHWGMYTLIVGISFLFVYLRTKKEGLIPGLLLTVIAIIGFMSFNPLDAIESTTQSTIGSIPTILLDLWPVVLIILGVVFILKRK
ncbi:DUF5668 domain-containing protein [Alkalihalophilus marmarensis]|jgi:hypothetical protein|uniref:LiaI-LiaF-like transmembrane region domain-containing protein n=1 Tax=Alkalihalophilus marmarensis DSM 21297 TaxID=1188261 RepID=U6SLI2_9BACI|nr:DUF5668 domain-containing protein [Alkalihalophilus marmarensis]ERN52438.1 hypothetical protein A33I_15565 [Alkalihalophilus marmarensis DSM 21297]MCM3487931.1 DUF5668 domain-containing protein [Alkalihalophilus marmarensis]